MALQIISDDTGATDSSKEFAMLDTGNAMLEIETEPDTIVEWQNGELIAYPEEFNFSEYNNPELNRVTQPKLFEHLTHISSHSRQNDVDEDIVRDRFEETLTDTLQNWNLVSLWFNTLVPPRNNLMDGETLDTLWTILRASQVYRNLWSRTILRSNLVEPQKNLLTLCDQQAMKYLETRPVILRAVEIAVEESEKILNDRETNYRLKIALDQDPECDNPDFNIIITVDNLSLEETLKLWDEIGEAAYNEMFKFLKADQSQNDEIHEFLEIFAIIVNIGRVV